MQKVLRMNNKNIFMILLFVLTIFGCEKTEYTLNSDNGPQVSDVIWFESIGSTILVADSASNVDIRISLNKLADTAFKRVNITTDKGLFANGEKSILIVANAERKAVATLYSGVEEGTAHIRATVNSISIDTSLQFIKALPNNIQINPSAIVTDKEKIKLGLKLGREEGRVGKDIMVILKYESLDTIGGILDIQPSMMVERETDSITISNPFNLKGRFEIIAKAQNQELDSISAASIFVFQ